MNFSISHFAFYILIEGFWIGGTICNNICTVHNLGKQNSVLGFFIKIFCTGKGRNHFLGEGNTKMVNLKGVPLCAFSSLTRKRFKSRAKAGFSSSSCIYLLVLIDQKLAQLKVLFLSYMGSDR